MTCVSGILLRITYNYSAATGNHLMINNLSLKMYKIQQEYLFSSICHHCKCLSVNSSKNNYVNTNG